MNTQGLYFAAQSKPPLFDSIVGINSELVKFSNALVMPQVFPLSILIVSLIGVGIWQMADSKSNGNVAIAWSCFAAAVAVAWLGSNILKPN